MAEGAKQRRPEDEVEPNVAANEAIEMVRHNYESPISTTRMWIAALTIPFYPY
jgi:hypothetical protein